MSADKIVCVRNIDHAAQEPEIKAFMESAGGKVVKVKFVRSNFVKVFSIITDSGKQNRRHFIFVEFETADMAKEAIQKLNETMMPGPPGRKARKITVDPKTDSSKNQRRNGPQNDDDYPQVEQAEGAEDNAEEGAANVGVFGTTEEEQQQYEQGDYMAAAKYVRELNDKTRHELLSTLSWMACRRPEETRMLLLHNPALAQTVQQIHLQREAGTRGQNMVLDMEDFIMASTVNDPRAMGRPY